MHEILIKRNIAIGDNAHKHKYRKYVNAYVYIWPFRNVIFDDPKASP